MDGLAASDALAQAALVRAREVSARELVEAAARRLEARAELNLLATSMVEEALAQAEQPLPDGPLAGVPILVKDLFAPCRGVRETEGSLFLRDHVATRDSATVGRLRAAGALILGRATTSELGNGSTAESPLFGATRNPWSLERSTGGSSGGSAAAVAARIVPAAHGNDGGGSLRIPASCCGIFGLKPARGRVPVYALAERLYSGLVSEHVFTWSVRDSAAFLDVLGERCAGERARPAFLAATAADPPPLRIAVATAPLDGAPVHEACVRATEETARLCRELGHEVVEAAPAIEPSMLDCFGPLWRRANAGLVAHWECVMGRPPEADELEPGTWARVESGRRVSNAAHAAARTTAAELERRLAAFFAEHDLWLTPTIAEPPVLLGTFAAHPEDPEWVLRRDAAYAPFTGLANLAGHPAMSLPALLTDDGLPVGSHFLGPRTGEALLLALAASLERAAPPPAPPGQMV